MIKLDCNNPFSSISEFIQFKDYQLEPEKFFDEVEVFFQKEAFQDKEYDASSLPAKESIVYSFQQLKRIAKCINLECCKYRMQQLAANISKVTRQQLYPIIQLRGEGGSWGWIPYIYIHDSLLSGHTDPEGISVPELKPTTLFFLQQYLYWKTSGGSLSLPYSGIVELRNFASQYSMHTLRKEIELVLYSLHADDRHLRIESDEPSSVDSAFFDPTAPDISVNSFMRKCSVLNLGEQRRFFSTVHRYLAQQFELQRKKNPNACSKDLLERTLTNQTVNFLVTALPFKNIHQQKLLATIQWVTNKFFSVPSRISSIQLIENAYKRGVQHSWVETNLPTEILRLKLISKNPLPFADLMTVEGKVSGTPKEEVELLLLAIENKWFNTERLVTKIVQDIGTNPGKIAQYLPCLIKNLQYGAVERICRSLDWRALCRHAHVLNIEETFHLVRALRSYKVALEQILGSLPVSINTLKAVERYKEQAPQSEQELFANFFKNAIVLLGFIFPLESGKVDKLTALVRHAYSEMQNWSEESAAKVVKGACLTENQASRLYHIMEDPDMVRWMNIAGQDNVRKGIVHGLLIVYPLTCLDAIIAPFIEKFFPQYQKESVFADFVRYALMGNFSTSTSRLPLQICPTWIIAMDDAFKNEEVKEWMQTRALKQSSHTLDKAIECYRPAFVRYALPVLNILWSLEPTTKENHKKTIHLLIDFLLKVYKSNPISKDSFRTELFNTLIDTDDFDFIARIFTTRKSECETAFKEFGFPEGYTLVVEAVAQMGLCRELLVRFPIQNDPHPRERKDKLFKKIMEYVFVHRSVPTQEDAAQIIEKSGYSHTEFLPSAYSQKMHQVTHDDSLRKVLFEFALMLQTESLVEWLGEKAGKEVVRLLLQAFCSLFDNLPGKMSLNRWLEVHSLVDHLRESYMLGEDAQYNNLTKILRGEKDPQKAFMSGYLSLATVDLALKDNKVTEWLSKDQQADLHQKFTVFKENLKAYDIAPLAAAMQIDQFIEVFQQIDLDSKRDLERNEGNGEIQNKDVLKMYRREVAHFLKKALRIIGSYSPLEQQSKEMPILAKIVKVKNETLQGETHADTIQAALNLIKSMPNLMALLKHENLSDAIPFLERLLKQQVAQPSCVIS